jgi:hypothetical protein
MTDEQRTKDRTALYAYLDAEQRSRDRRNAKFPACGDTPRDVAHEAWAMYTAEHDAAFDAFIAAVLANHAPEPQVGPRMLDGVDGDAD